MKKKLIIVLMVTLFMSCVSRGFYVKDDLLYYDNQMITSVSLQENSDILRLQHLKYYVELIEEYKQVVGRYPFESDIPSYVYIANSIQEQFTKEYDEGIPYFHVTINFAELITELEDKLNITIPEYYDPQYAPDIKPNWYVYAVMGGDYYFAVHIHQEFEFSKKLGPYYNKVEVSNVPNYGANLIYSSEKLFSLDSYNKEISTILQNEEYFKDRELKHLHETKNN